jgi:hypothetical protein
MYGERSMKKTTQTETATQSRYHIAMTLTGGTTADFYYSDRSQAENHYNQLGATMNLGGQAIKTIKLVRPQTAFNLVA